MLFMIVCLLIVCIWSCEVYCYIFLLPKPDQSSTPTHPLLSACGTAAYSVAYVLSLMRAPLGLLPYLVKLFIFFVLRIRYEATRTSYARELLNMCGDFLNLAGTWWLVLLLVGAPELRWLSMLCYLPIGAECMRLFAERVPTVFSAAWQILPHRKIAHTFQHHARLQQFFGRYCHYYTLSDSDRAASILITLKQRASADPAVRERMEYLQAFRIISARQGLRGGLVRDVARGEVFVHASWTSDPWLLIGMALRRTPWPFDPRYLQRPFYYMSGANRVTSLFVLQHALYSLPYALFQLGHEIRVGRLHFFYVLLRWSGADVERKVYADGTFQNDQFIFWLRKTIGKTTALIEPHPLYSDAEVKAELQRTHETLTLEEIATRYTYPQKYVEEVLWPQITTTRDSHTIDI